MIQTARVAQCKRIGIRTVAWNLTHCPQQNFSRIHKLANSIIFYPWKMCEFCKNMSLKNVSWLYYAIYENLRNDFPQRNDDTVLCCMDAACEENELTLWLEKPLNLILAWKLDKIHWKTVSHQIILISECVFSLHQNKIFRGDPRPLFSSFTPAATCDCCRCEAAKLQKSQYMLWKSHWILLMNILYEPWILLASAAIDFCFTAAYLRKPYGWVLAWWLICRIIAHSFTQVQVLLL